ncbi:AraC family transcription regulator [Streptomyces lincolnensis]|uniref:AraC family transcription regulator n=1 Tax=Streptomyces lincolnensis TaxID=1915 RepID=A0A1B1M4A9_STRLN|nr:AraC family transcriptional regulator [Streptomyces lincolnensis]ANS63243.1 AraC family transcription regulator [Streptomyces lincolnensis]AXG52166.1 AraC family transcription regulator [Streptomyces lincolnensis]QMV05143.1 helix-turn-helix domain-containing protein [Streptomyces lincolnensis]
MVDRLARAVERHCEGLWSETAVPRLSLVALDEFIEPTEMMYEPMVCFIAEGSKRTAVGDRCWVTPRGEMALITLDMPVTAAFEKVPYRAAVMRLDSRALAAVQMELEETGPPSPPDVSAAVTASMAPELVDAVTRWVQLLDAPADIRPLASGIESEILYRLLRGPLGPVLSHWSMADSAASRIRTAARWICDHYTESLSIGEIAAVAGMSPATLHRHFKAATGMSPLRFHKRLRLQEARRRLFTGDMTAAQAAQAVGYVSATQFNREYRSAYGLPPGQDAARLRARLADGGESQVLLDGSGAKP